MHSLVTQNEMNGSFANLCIDVVSNDQNCIDYWNGIGYWILYISHNIKLVSLFKCGYRSVYIYTLNKIACAIGFTLQLPPTMTTKHGL